MKMNNRYVFLRKLFFVLAFIVVLLLCMYYDNGYIDEEDNIIFFGKYVINGFFGYTFAIIYTMTVTMLFFKEKSLHIIGHLCGVLSICLFMVASGNMFTNIIYGLPTLAAYLVFGSVAHYIMVFCVRHITKTHHLDDQDVEIPIDQIT